VDLFSRPEWRLAVALAIGLVVGAERERRKGAGAHRRPAGIRTFALASLIGGVAALLPWPAVGIAVGAVFIAGFAIVGYAFGDRADPGYTTEIALCLTYVLGVLAQSRPAMAFSCGIVAAILLALRNPMHHAVRDVVTSRELLDALVFAVAAVVILPLLPNRPIDPLGVINPFTLWRLVVVVMAITGAGYIAQRAIGPKYGLAVAGLAAGFVSSAATIHAMGTRARSDERLLPAAVAGATASCLATFVQMTILVGTANPGLVRRVATPLVAGALVAALFGAALTARSARAETVPTRRGRAFKVRSAIVFAGVVTAILFAAAGMEKLLGEVGAVGAAAVAGLADAHAAGASAASLNAAGKLGGTWAEIAVLLALTSNTVTKIVLAHAAGPRRFGMRISFAVTAMLAATWAAYAIQRLVVTSHG
jgi:uncharacterized membrane protein (DUF4010 family)